MTAHQRLIEELTAERYDNRWWLHNDLGGPDTDEARARRRADLDRAWQADNNAHPDRRVAARRIA